MKKAQWYRVWKFYRGGMNETYIETTEDNARRDAIYWAENSDGGQNDGYQLNWERRHPSSEWLKQEIFQLERHLNYLRESVKECNDKILHYKMMVK